MKWQIFAPIALLQLINLFWYFLIWRILIRCVTSSSLEATVLKWQGVVCRPEGRAIR